MRLHGIIPLPSSRGPCVIRKRRVRPSRAFPSFTDEKSSLSAGYLLKDFVSLQNISVNNTLTISNSIMGNLLKRIFSFGKKSEAKAFEPSETSVPNEISNSGESGEISQKSESIKKSDTRLSDKKFIKVDWTKIEKIAREEPERAKELIQRVTSSGWNEVPRSDYVMAYCLQSYVEFDCKENDLPIVRKPMDITAALTTRNWLAKYIEECPEDQKRSVHGYLMSMEIALMQMFVTINATGDGSAKHPFVVVSIADEYAFMREFLKLPKHTSQALMSNNCDKFTLSGTSEKYQSSEIYFEITRVLQKEQEMFGQ